MKGQPMTLTPNGRRPFPLVPGDTGGTNATWDRYDGCARKFRRPAALNTRPPRPAPPGVPCQCFAARS